MTAAAANKNAPPKAAPPALRVASGKSNKPDRILIYGPEGVGKSSLAVDYGKVIVIDCEDGTRKIDVDRYVFDDHGRTRPRTFDEVHSVIGALGSADHDYQALVIDGLDELERLVHERVCAVHSDKGGKKHASIESFGFQKGYKIAVEEWRRFAAGLEWLQARRNMAIIFVAHTQLKTHGNSFGDDYDRYTVLLHKDAAAFLKGWVDVLGFMNYEDQIADKPSDDTKKIGIHFGERKLHLNRSAAFDAKGRTDGDHQGEIVIPKENPWAPVREALGGKSK